MRRRLGASALIVALSLGSAACAAIFGFEELGSENYKVEDSSVPEVTTPDAGDAAIDNAVKDPCSELGIPDKPSLVDGGAAEDRQIVVAINTFDIGFTTPAGFNLDRTCSPTRDKSSCVPGGSVTDFDEFGKDTDSVGTDNAGFPLLKTVGAFGGGFEPTEINKRLREGEFGAVIRITKWNGGDEDPDVVVELFPAFGVDVNDGTGNFVRKTNKVDGGFVSDDRWLRDRRFQGISGVSTQFTLNAWVTKGRVYGRFNKLTVPVSVPDDAKPLDLVLNEAVFSAKIVPDGSRFRLTDGVVGGRVATKDFLGNVRTIYVLDNNGVKDAFICSSGTLGPTLYSVVKGKVCAARDIRSVDDPDRTKGCDAFSVGFRLDSYVLTNDVYYSDENGFFDAGPDATAPRCVTNSDIPENDDCPPAAP
ncbi:MAG: hypothetical protein JST00_14080 [Deltaproteobacteria bacterium]|nr:hypothetical protein [Deltaproteobacteria bacterium]